MLGVQLADPPGADDAHVDWLLPLSYLRSQVLVLRMAQQRGSALALCRWILYAIGSLTLDLDHESCRRSGRGLDDRVHAPGPADSGR